MSFGASPEGSRRATSTQGFSHATRTFSCSAGLVPNCGDVTGSDSKSIDPVLDYSVLNLPFARHALVEIDSAELGQLLDLVLEEVIGPGDHLVLDDDALQVRSERITLAEPSWCDRPRAGGRTSRLRSRAGRSRSPGSLTPRSALFDS